MPLQAAKRPGSVEPPKPQQEPPVADWEGEGGQIPSVPTTVADGNNPRGSLGKKPKRRWGQILRQWVKRLTR